MTNEPAEALSGRVRREQVPERPGVPADPHAASQGSPETQDEAPAPHASPVAELRTAAAKLRKLAGKATQAPWGTAWNGQQHELRGPDEAADTIAEWTYAIVTIGPKVGEQRAECDTADAAYIAAMDPAVGAELVKLLDLEADVIEARAMEDGGSYEFAVDLGGDHILAIARLINGAAVTA